MGAIGAVGRLRRAFRLYKELRKRGAPTIPILVLAGMGLVGVFGPQLAPHDPTGGSLEYSLAPPFWMDGRIPGYLLGTDFQGRDILSRILAGAQITMLSAAAGLTGACLIGTTLGLVSGYLGGGIDALVMRAVDFMLALPGLLLAMVLVAALGPSLTIITLTVMLVGWVPYARFIRAEVLSIKKRDYVTAAVAMGCHDGRIMFKHLLPNVTGTILVLATLQTGGIILLVASLSFLGLGIPKPTAAWGVMIADGRDWLAQAWWVAGFPGLAISAMVISLNLVGDWMRDYFDPRLRGSQVVL